MTPFSRPTCRRPLSLIGLVLAACTLACLPLVWTAGTLSAQQPPPSGRGPDEPLRRYGTRQLLTTLDAPGDVATTATLHIANNGFHPARILVVELAKAAPPDGANCPNGLPAERIVGALCPDLVPPYGATDLAVSGQTASALVYSLNAISITDACAAIDAVKNGTKTMDAFEREVWQQNIGDPIAVSAVATTDRAATAWTGRTGLEAVGAGRPGSGGLRLNLLPIAWPGAGGGRVRAMNSTSQCQTLPVRQTGPTGQNIACPESTTRAARLPAYSAVDWAAPDAPASLAMTGTAQIALTADRLDAAGWMSYLGPTAGGMLGGDLAFPLAMGPFSSTVSTLWVTNQHPTATAQIDILMWDGNGKLIKAYTDPVPLCAGAARSYAVEKLAGTVETTHLGGRSTGGLNVDLPPMVSFRVEASNRSLPDAPPIGGVLVLHNDMGITAYAGMSPSGEVQSIQGPRSNRVQATTLIPDFKINDGTPPESTFLAGQNVLEPAANVMLINLYDPAGNLVAEDLSFLMGGGMTGSTFVDLSLLAGRSLGPDPKNTVPQHFHGTAVIRGSDAGPFGQYGVVAINHLAADLPVTRSPRQQPPPMPPPFAASLPEFRIDMMPQDRQRTLNRTQLPGDRDRLAAVTGILLPRWLNVAAGPTPPSRPTPGRTPGTPGTPPMTPGTPVVRPTRGPTVEPTPTTGEQRHRLWLPLLWYGGVE